MKLHFSFSNDNPQHPSLEVGPTRMSPGHLVYNAPAMNQEQSEKVVQAWRESARYWEKHRQIIRQAFDPITRAMIQEAGISEGQSVLDVAGGSGEPALTIAEVVGPRGRAVCTDVADEMVAVARREAARRGLTNVEFQQCSAQSLPFNDDSFDAVVCRLGVMFFPDPLAALRQMLRVTRSGGEVTLAVWCGPEVNPFFRVVAEVMSRYIESPPEEPDAPGAFRFADPGRIAGTLARAGARDVRERTLSFNIEGAVRLEDFWTLRSELSDTLREKVSRLTSDQLIRVSQEVQETVRQYFANDNMRFPAQVFIVTGRKL